MSRPAAAVELESRMILKRGRLKDSVVGKMQHKAGGREIARNREPRVHCLPVQQQLIVVPAEPGADGPISQVDQILHKRGLLKVRAIRRKAESRWRARIELSWDLVIM